MKRASVLLAVIVVAACGNTPVASSPPASSPPAGSSLTGQPWALSAVTGKTPAFQGVVPAYQQPDYTITFDTGGTYTGTAACNQIAGTYTTSGDSLTMTAGASTLAFCPQVAADIDYGIIFAHALTEASTYAVANDTLTITLTDGGTMTFGSLSAIPSRTPSRAVASLRPGASPLPALLGKTWKLTGITELTPAFQGVVPEADQSNYTIEFKADRTFDATADCNQVGGTYSLGRGGDPTGTEPLEGNAGGITMLPVLSTSAACPPGSMADLFMIGLGNTSSFALEDDQLTITLKDGGKLHFTA